MDSMRSILMVLGIVSHSSLVFNPSQNWIIHTDYSSNLAYWLYQGVLFFRMHSFYLIAGFFFALSLNKYSPGQAFVLKIKRIIIPLVSTVVIVNSIQYLLLVRTGWSTFDPGQYLHGGQYISHTWFLVYLFCFFGVTLLVSIIPFTGILKDRLVKMLTAMPIIVIAFLFPMLSVGAFWAYQHGFPLYADLQNVFWVNVFFSYLPFYILGYFLGCSRILVDRFAKMDIRFSIFLLAAALMSRYPVMSQDGFWPSMFFTYADTLARLAAIMVCFNIFYNFLNRKSGVLAFLSQASYTVYIFHHLFVVLIGIFLIHVNIYPPLGLLILLPTVLVVTLLIHKYAVSKSSLLSFLFNGKTKPGPPNPADPLSPGLKESVPG